MMKPFIDHFYVCEDLSKLGSLDIHQFPNLKEAVTAYRALPDDKVKALGAQNTLPLPGSLDFVQHLKGKDWLLSDCLRLPAWHNEEVQNAMRELRDLLPDVQQRTIRFITPEYKDLFTLKDGESLVIRHMDGTTKNIPCFACSDGCHFYLGTNQLFHICQFAEISRANGTTYLPQSPHEGERIGTYEIYQLIWNKPAAYRFADYAFAKDKINATDYHHAYSGMLAKDTTLDDLYTLHNRDDRPFAHQMPSLSMSNIIIIEKAGKRTAYYVDTFDFAKLPDSFERSLSKTRKSPKRNDPER